MVNGYTYEKVTPDNVEEAKKVIADVFPPADREGVQISFDLSVTAREKWHELCEAADSKAAKSGHNSGFNEQFEPLSTLEYFIIRAPDGSVAGVSGLYSYKGEENEAWVGWLGVAKDKQGHGYGKAVLDHVVDMAKANGCDTLRLWTDNPRGAEDPARAMYERIGFVTQGTLRGIPQEYDIMSLNLLDPTQPPVPWDGYLTKGLAGAHFLPP